MDQQDKELAQRCRALHDSARQAESWLKDNSEAVGSAAGALQKEMRHAARFFGKCEAAARRKMCVGVFGPSQSGKSYLISALARTPQGALLADFCGTTHDFITEINPEGGRESTGLVTRFTTTPPPDMTPDFPIRLRLLTETDVVRVLANTYYADCDHKDAPDAEALDAALDELEQTAGPENNAVSADDVEDLREYLQRNFASRPRVQMLQYGYWTRAAALAPRLDTAGRARLFSQIWNGTPQFHDLLLSLSRALEALGRPAEVDCPDAALLPRTQSIIDVVTLQRLDKPDDGDSLPLRAVQGGRTARLPRAVITALTAELTIVMREKPDDFFDYTDLLDFPGYRSRYQLDDLTRALEREDKLSDLFLRGKVAYLFERYCEERELTSMLLCIGPGNQEVQDLPRAIQEWIASTHGEDPRSRAGRPSALFFVLTKMDMEFEKKAGMPSVEKRWDIRLHASLLDFFGKQYDWPHNWDGTHPFTNTFLLRNPNFRCEAVFEFDADGREKNVRPDQEAFVADVRRAFLDSETVRRHVANPGEVWDAAMRLNDGGVALLRQRLRPLCNPELKREQLRVSLAEQCRGLTGLLQAYCPSGDAAARRAEKAELARRLARALAQVASAQRLGKLMRRLQVEDWQLYNVCIRMSRTLPDDAQTPPTGIIGRRVKAEDLLLDIFGDEAPLPEPAESAAPLARDTVDILTDHLLDYWFDQLRDFAADTQARALFALPEDLHNALCRELQAAALRLRLRERMAEALRAASAYGNIERERLFWKQASIAADAINAFVDWLGFDPRHTAANARTIPAGNRTMTVFEPPAAFQGEPHIEEKEQAYEFAWYRDWLAALAHVVTENAALADGTLHDPAQTERLRAILHLWKD